MQAWKKTANYLRYHSWYADTLGLDIQSLRIPFFIREIQECLKEPEKWQAKPLRIVPAPKSQRWTYKSNKSDSSYEWGPIEKGDEKKIRPLAHVDLQDQVVATAMMLCLADRVETKLGNPCLDIKEEDNRSRVLAYGHRLFCDEDEENDSRLRHRWGSSKLYRSYYQDYQTFLERPKFVAETLKAQESNNYEVAIVQSDLSKFYDRVRPNLLHKKLRLFQKTEQADEVLFFDLAERVFNWRWDKTDTERADRYKEESELTDFEEIALPQGLVASGFFSNIVLADFGAALRRKIKKIVGKKENYELTLHDVCYYVDDLRLVLTLQPTDSGNHKSSTECADESGVEKQIGEVLQKILSSKASGLKISKEKTKVIFENRDKRFLIRQSREANRIQTQASGVLDMHLGAGLIGAIESFFHTQQRFSFPDRGESDSLLVGIPDMADDTVARFSAGKFRRIFRLLRPLLGNNEEPLPDSQESESDVVLPTNMISSKSQLDERGKQFAIILIEEWVKNPGNVRLLRIALDIYPDHEFLNRILRLLSQGWKEEELPDNKREIMLYCLAEVFRVGAIETGIVPTDEKECLPGNVSITEYHDRLIREGREIFLSCLKDGTLGLSRFPWYLMQQVFLYLSVRNQIPRKVISSKPQREPLLRHYWKFAKFLHGQPPKSHQEHSVFIVEANSAMGIQFNSLKSAPRISPALLQKINSIAPTIAQRFWVYIKPQAGKAIQRQAIRLRLIDSKDWNSFSLRDIATKSDNPFYQEESLLNLAEFLLHRKSELFAKAITPWDIRYTGEIPSLEGQEFAILSSRGAFEIQRTKNSSTALFEAPEWCGNNEERQRFNVGLLLRYALRGTTGFLDGKPYGGHAQEFRYRKPISHWEQQRYSGYQGREAFGPDWLPISSFTENILFDLLRWPGARAGQGTESVEKLLQKISSRLDNIRRKKEQFTSSAFLEQTTPYNEDRLFRVGIIQSIIPGIDDYKSSDLQLKGAKIRADLRRHLASIISGVEQMLRIRNTHQKAEKSGVDLLIFPELAVHPEDIKSFIIPFVRKYRCIILFGQVYHPKDTDADSPLINSGLWVIPQWSSAQGLQIKYLEQGKMNLSPEEKEKSVLSSQRLIGFRPVQWLIECRQLEDLDNPDSSNRPLRLTASICYDATDVALMADIQSRSDLYIICALNEDVGTFDRMAEALHYHMFQGVILVNNGNYGGSSFFMPFYKSYRRQIFHLQGQPYVSINFVELSPKKLIRRPNENDKDLLPLGKWKQPPAGWENPGESD